MLFIFAFVSLRSLQRALDRRLYLLLYGTTYGAPDGKPVWHFPEKVYGSEETLRKVINLSDCCYMLLFCCIVLFFFPLFLKHLDFKCLQCAESALESVIGGLSHTYFVGNAPFAHMVIQPTENEPDLPSFKVHFFVM